MDARQQPLDRALIKFVLDVALMFEAVDDDFELDEDSAVRWLEDLGAAYGSLSDDDRRRFQAIGSELADEVAADPFWAGRAVQMREMLASLDAGYDD